MSLVRVGGEIACNECGAPCKVTCYLAVKVEERLVDLCSHNCWVKRCERLGLDERTGRKK